MFGFVVSQYTIAVVPSEMARARERRYKKPDFDVKTV